MNSKKKWLMILVMTFCSFELIAQLESSYFLCKNYCDGESSLGIYRYKFEWDDTTYFEDFLITRYYDVERYWGGEKDSIWQSNTYSSRISYYTVFHHLNVSNYQKHRQIFAPFSAFAFREPFLCNPSCDVQRGAFLRFFDLRAEASAKDSLEDNCWNGRFFLMEKIHYPEGSDNVLYKFEIAEKNREKPTSMFIQHSFLSFFELQYLHNIGFLYMDIRVPSTYGKWVKLTLTHIEGVPLEEYLRDCKGTLCPYFGN